MHHPHPPPPLPTTHLHTPPTTHQNHLHPPPNTRVRCGMHATRPLTRSCSRSRPPTCCHLPRSVVGCLLGRTLPRLPIHFLFTPYSLPIYFLVNSYLLPIYFLFTSYCSVRVFLDPSKCTALRDANSRCPPPRPAFYNPSKFTHHPPPTTHHPPPTTNHQPSKKT